MGVKAKVLVIDTSGFVKNKPLWEYGETLVSVDEVFDEIKNKELQQYVAAFPVEVDFKQPKPESIKFINEFSKKTGDYHTLSLTDVKVLALTYELEVEGKGSDSHLRTEPVKRVTNTQKSVAVGGIKRPHPTQTLESLPELEEIEDDQVNEDNHSMDHNQSSNNSNNSNNSADKESEEDDWCVVKRRKVKRNSAINELPLPTNDNVSVTSSVARRRTENFVRDMQPGFYFAPNQDDDQNWSVQSNININSTIGTSVNTDILSQLEEHLSTYSYVAGYQPEWIYEVLMMELVSFLFEANSTLFPSTHLTSAFEADDAWYTFLQQLESDGLSYLRRALDSGESFQKMPVSQLDLLYPSIQRWIKHITSLTPTRQQSSAATTVQEECTDLLESINRALEAGVDGGDEADDEADDDVDDEDGGGWLTVDNINKPKDDEAAHSFGDGQEEEQEQAHAACMTSDFAMQNVLRHIGLAVLGVDGKLIKNTRCYVLRCFTCYTVTSDMNKIFCPKCGNKTLKRVAMTVNPDGTQNIWISRKPLRTRGLRFNLPKPRGGQHAIMPLLTADQRFPHQWAKRSKTVSPLDEDYIAGPSPFTARDLTSRAAQYGLYTSSQHRGIKGQLKHAKIWKPKNNKRVKK